MKHSILSLAMAGDFWGAPPTVNAALKQLTVTPVTNNTCIQNYPSKITKRTAGAEMKSIWNDPLLLMFSNRDTKLLFTP